MFRTKQVFATFSALCLMAGISACSSDDGGDSSEDPIRVGASISKTGSYSESAEFYLNGIKLWVDKTNDAGGVGGRKIELTTYDDKSTAEEARLLAERLVSRDEVDLLIGPYSAPVTASVAQVAEREKVPMIASLAGDNAIWEGKDVKWSVHAYVPGHTEMEGLIDIMESEGASNLAIVNEESSNFIKTAEHTTKLAEEAGIDVTRSGYDPGTLDFNPIVDKISSGSFDAIALLTYAPESTELLNSLKQRGVNVAGIAGTTIGDAGVAESIDASTRDGLIYRTPWSADRDTEGNPEFVKTFEAAYGAEPSYHAAAGYAGGQVAGAALAAAGTESEELIDYLRSESIPSVLGEYKVNDESWQVGYANNLMQFGPDGKSELVWTREDGVQPELAWPRPDWK